MLGLIDDVIAAVHIQGFAGNQARGIMREEGGGDPDVIDRNEVAARRFATGLVEQLVEFGNP